MENSLKTKFWEITQKIIECAMNVHNDFKKTNESQTILTILFYPFHLSVK